MLGSAALAAGALLAPRPLVRAALAALAAFAAGALALGVRLEQARAGPETGFEATLEGRVGELARLGHEVRATLHEVVRIDERDPPLPERIELWSGLPAGGRAALAGAVPGDRVRVRARLRPPGGLRNPGGRDVARALARRGIGARAQLVHPDLFVPLAKGGGGLRRLHALRQRVAGRLAATGPGGALLQALALGDRSGLGVETRAAFGRLGVSHLLAVSGLHLALVAAAVYALARHIAMRSARLAARGDVRRPALLLAATGAVGYALLAGWGVPVRRALIVLGALVLGLARRRPSRRGHPLAAAALWILAREPAALFEAGTQLSFAASAALLLATRREDEPDQGAGGRLRRALGVSSAAICATAPIAASGIGVAAPAALGANLVLVPWTTFVLLPAALLSVPLATLDGEAARLALVPCERVAAATLQAVAVVADLVPAPHLALRPGPPWIAVALAAGLLALLVRSLVVRVVAALAIPALLSVAPPARVRPEPPRVVFLDVGQGDATLVQGRRAALLVDGGLALPGGLDLGRQAVLPALAALGVRRLALVVATHADADHRGGLAAVLDAVPVGRLWLPRGAQADPAFDGLRDVAGRRGIPVQERGAGDPSEPFGDLWVEPLWPPDETPGLAGNDRSLVLRVSVAGHRVLLPGDLEAGAEQALFASEADVRADILKLAHHGSHTSSGAAWLSAVGAEVAVASAPCAGRFAMPHPEVVQRVRDVHASLWWTGRDGAVLLGLQPRPWVRGWGASREDCAP